MSVPYHRMTLNELVNVDSDCPLVNSLQEHLTGKSDTYSATYQRGYADGVDSYNEELEEDMRDQASDSYNDGYYDGFMGNDEAFSDKAEY